MLMKRARWLFLLMLIGLAGCNPTQSVVPSPTPAVTAVPVTKATTTGKTETPRPTRSPTSIPSPTFAPSPTVTSTPTPAPSPTPVSSPTATPGVLKVVPTPGHLDFSVQGVFEIGSYTIAGLQLHQGGVFWEGRPLNSSGRARKDLPYSIYRLDLDSGENTVVATSVYTSGGIICYTDVSDRWLTWITLSDEWTGSDWLLCAKDLTTGEEMVLDSFREAGKVNRPRPGPYPALSGSTFAWSSLYATDDDGPLTTHLWVRDLDSGQQITPTSATEPEAVGFVDVDGQRVVWSRGSMAGGKSSADVFMYDLETQQTVQLSDDGRSGQPRIYGDTVVWRRGFGDTGPIVIHDLASGETISLREVGGAPDVGDGLVSWRRWTGKFKVYLYDIASNTFQGIVPMPREGHPKHYKSFGLFGRQVVLVYEDTSTGTKYIEVRTY